MLGKVRRHNWNRRLRQTENKANKKITKAETVRQEGLLLDLTAEDAAAAQERQRILFTRVLPAVAIGIALIWYMKKRRK